MDNKSYRTGGGVQLPNGRGSRVRRQRSKEWREYPSSSDNDDGHVHRPYNMDSHYLDSDMRNFSSDRGRIRRGGSGSKVNDYGSDTEEAENRRDSPRLRQPNLMSHTEPTDPLTSPYSSLPRSQHGTAGIRIGAPPTPGSNTNSLPRSRLSNKRRRGGGHSSSSSDNNSDATYTDSDLALTQRQNHYNDSPPEPAPPEIPPRNITMPYVDSIRRTRLGYLESECESEPPYMPCSQGTNNKINETGAKNVNSKASSINNTSVGANDHTNKTKGSHDPNKCVPPLIAATESNTTTTTTASSIPPMLSNKDSTTGPLLPVMQNSMHYVQTQSSNSTRFSTSFNHPSMYSSHFTSSRFTLSGKQCQERCSWKMTTVILVIALILLCSTLGYFAAVNSVPNQKENSQSPVCATEMKSTTPSTTVTPLVPKPYISSSEKIYLGNQTSKRVSPHHFWKLSFHQFETAFVRFNVTLPRESTFGIFIRRSFAPSPLQYDFLEVVSQGKIKNNKIKRATRHRSGVSFTHYLMVGEWFLSIYNDNNNAHRVTILPSVDKNVPHTCEHDCNGHGICRFGECECFPGYYGSLCSEIQCPILCSDHGMYAEGICQCSEGWKGQDCSIPSNQCEVRDCNRNGRCESGACVCKPGFKGKFCELEDCPDPKCSNHGICIGSSCHCKAGWKGRICNLVDNRITQCLPNCSDHGVYDVERERCICEKHWLGLQCSIAKCDLDCGPNGQCQNGRCVCVNGWTGKRCNQRSCDARCFEHGQCNNGTCVCIQGWSGKHCSIDGCPNSCNNHGDCKKEDEMDEDSWKCHCKWGWDGDDCGTLLETNCQDQKDNDGDGLVDCADSECCTDSSCRDSLMCVSSPDPLDVLLRKPPPAITASFYQRMKFLIDENSVQSYAHEEDYTERRVSVIRGQVVSKRGTGLIGIRVSVASDPQLGFTLTRTNGWFDILVNGGGAITLQFQRNPFRPTMKTVLVPWNKIVIMEKAVLYTLNEETDETEDSTAKSPSCSVHNYDKMSPIIYQTWKTGFEGGCSTKSVIYSEHQVLQESLQVSGADISLLYFSSHSPGFKSTIHMRLTPAIIPQTLRLIRLKIIVEGVIFEKKFEADANVTFTYAWNKRNIYRQKVYGLAEATIFIGYEYKDCKHIVEELRTSYLQGYDMDISNLGGWNLNIHHRYNFDQGILQKGDGTKLYFQQGPRVIRSVMGTGEQRPLECKSDYCNGEIAAKSSLLAPVAITAGSDGSVYVGDFNLVRRIRPDGNIHTILRLSTTKVSYQYYLAFSPTDGDLYLSDPERHQILRIKSIERPSDDPSNNYEVTAGSGHKCLPGDKDSCGDGRTALEAKLIYPKGLAISTDNTMYFADGPAIRSIDSNGIRTLIGSNNPDQWMPVSCTGTTLKATEVRLRWPTDVSVNPLDGSVYVLDDRLIIKITRDNQVMLVAGHWAHCHSSTYSDDRQSLSLGDMIGMSFAPNGDLYIVQRNSDNVNQIHLMQPDGTVAHIAGRNTKCDCLKKSCSCPRKVFGRAPETLLSSVSAIATSPHGDLYIADKGSLQILQISPYLPSDDKNIVYEIAFPEAQEIYVFNKYGQHVVTKNILTGKAKYTFSYNVNTSYGKLSTITDASGNKISFLRDYNNIENTIENAHGLKCRVRMTQHGLLDEFEAADKMKTMFTYTGSTGLLVSRIDSAGQTFIYKYDVYGRLRESVTPTGELYFFKFSLGQDGATVIVRHNGHSIRFSAEDSKVTMKRDDSTFAMNVVQQNEFISMTNTSGRSVKLTKSGHSVLEAMLPLQAGILPMPSGKMIEIDNDLVSQFNWKFIVNYDGREHSKLVTQVSRQLWINGSHLMSVEYDWLESRETFYDINHRPLLGIQYDTLSKPTQLLPGSKGLPLNLMYDRFGRISSWRRGQSSEKYTYNLYGQLTEIKYMDGSTTSYQYENKKTKPHKITLPSGNKFAINYDKYERLQSVVTPTGSIHSFLIQTSLGFYKLFYHPPGSARSPYMQKFRDDGKLLMQIYPSDSGRVLYNYNPEGKLVAILYGTMKTEYEYNDDGMCTKQSLIDNTFQTTAYYVHYGNIVKGIKTKFLSKVALSNAEFNYVRDKRFNLKRIAVKIGTHDLPHMHFSIDDKFGHVDRIANFRVSRHRENSTSLNDGVATYTRIQDLYYRDVTYSLVIGSAEVFRMEIEYNNRNLLSLTKVHSRSMGHMTTKNQHYIYDKDGQLLEMTGKDKWKFAYDNNGNMIMMNYRGNEINLKYDEDDRIASFAEMAFTVDDRGFVTKRGVERFFYNHKGQLSHAIRPGRYSVWYYYDARDRLAVRMDNMRNVTQYFYAYDEQPDLVSHIHSPVNGKVMTLTYNDRGHLMKAQMNRENFYIVTDHMGTPLLLMNPKGEVVKEIHRGPYGHVLFDSNRNFYLPIDFHGGILDSITGLIHFTGGRVYDPLLGLWVTPSWDDVQNRVSDPLSMHLYRFNRNNPVNRFERPTIASGIEEWFARIGFNIGRVAFDANPLRSETRTSESDGQLVLPSRGIDVKSGLLCSAQNSDSCLRRLRTVPDSLVKSRQLRTSFHPRITSLSVPFGVGMTLTRLDDGQTQIKYVDEANPIARDVYSSVFNNAHFLDVILHHNNQDVFFFVKEDSWRVADDLNQLQRLGNTINMTVHESNGGNSDGSAKHVDVRLTMNNVIVNVLYGMQPDVERKRLLRHAKRRAVSKKWELVRKFVVEQPLSGKFVPAQQWTEKEKERIVKDGSLSGYYGEYFHSVNKYPELADDPHNIVLKKNSNKKQHRNRLKRYFNLAI
ncbi:TENM2 (predicted) [Pycnogonum litorale]